MCFLVHHQSVSLEEGLATCLAQCRLLADLEFLFMQPWVGVPAACGGAQLALLNRFVASVGAGLE